MFGFENIGINFSFNYTFLIIGIILLALYSFYIYRYTLPPVASSKKYLLIFFRSIALILILFVFFEPVLTLTKKDILIPGNIFFFDNSRSIKIEDKSDRSENEKKIFEAISNFNLSSNKEFYTFGSIVKPISTDSLDKLNFIEPTTNFSSIFTNLNTDKKNIAAITIISDGVITEGSTPIYTAEKLGIPVFTVGIGDSSQKNDVEIINVLHNDYIYSGTPTSILATILNKGFAGKNVSVSLLDGNQIIGQQEIVLDKNGTNTISLDFTPKQSGEKKLTVKLSSLDGEASLSNNQNVFYINVLSNKIDILLISGSPSPDLTFIKNTLSDDPNLKVNTLTQISSGNFLEQNATSKLDSANVIYLIGFPTESLSEDFYNRLIRKLDNENIPVFFILTADVSVSRLNRLKNVLPFTVQKIENNYLQVQPEIQTSEINNTLIESNSISEWNNLPPVDQPFSTFIVNPESKVIAKVKIGSTLRNNPLIVTRNFGSKRSVGILAKNIWKWKLQTANKNLSLFDNFILNSTRWLNAPDDKKRVRIKTSKKLYASNEQVDFSAQVYDEAFNPVNDAVVKVEIDKSGNKSELILTPLGNGLYEGKFQPEQNGDYSYSGNALMDTKVLGSDNGNFNVGDVDIELLNPRMNFELLNSLSNQTNGKFFTPQQINILLSTLNDINSKTSKEKLIITEIRMWSDEWLLIIIILLFAIEWFIRKRSGML